MQAPLVFSEHQPAMTPNRKMPIQVSASLTLELPVCAR